MRHEFHYSPRLPYFMLKGDELTNLDIEATDWEFRRAINGALCGVAPREDLTEFVVDQSLDDDEYNIIPLDYRIERDDWMDVLERGVKDKFINMQWLVYTSPEAHAKAMANNYRQDVVNHAIVFWVYMGDLHGISRDRVREIESQYKDEKKRGAVEFVLAS